VVIVLIACVCPFSLTRIVIVGLSVLLSVLLPVLANKRVHKLYNFVLYANIQWTNRTNRYDWVPAENVVAEIDHSIAWHGRRRSVSDAFYLENDLAIITHVNAISVGHRQRSTSVEKCVEVFSPNGINWTVKNQPHVRALYTRGNSVYVRRRILEIIAFKI